MVMNLHNIYIALLQNIALQFTPPSVYNTANLHWSPAATLASASRLSIFFSGHWASIQRSAIKLDVRWASFNFRVEKKRWIQFTVMKYSEQKLSWAMYTIAIYIPIQRRGYVCKSKRNIKIYHLFLWIPLIYLYLQYFYQSIKAWIFNSLFLLCLRQTRRQRGGKRTNAANPDQVKENFGISWKILQPVDWIPTANGIQSQP